MKKNNFNKKKIIFILIYLVFILSFFIIIELILRINNYGINTELFVEKNINGSDYYVINKTFINKYFPGSMIKRKVSDKIIFNKSKDIKTIRGFVIGGSTADGFPYNSNESFGKMSERVLRGSEILSDIEIYNLGASAMSSYYVYDVAKKLLKYNPDFLVVYSGHNEYYGTFGGASGKSHSLKRLYLFLKEFKIFQFLIGIIENKRSENMFDTTLMERLYAEKIIEPEDKINEIVVKNFIKNIEDVVSLYSSKGIPVILIEPVSNIFSMSPFKGYDDVPEEFIRSYTSVVIKENNIEESFKFYYKNKDKYNYDPLKRYLDGLLRYKIGDKDFIEDLEFAKDNDRIPFRAKMKLLKSLEDFYIKNKVKYKHCYYIELYRLLKDISNNKLGNNFFCDHLHFNTYGNVSLSFFLSERIAQIFNRQLIGKKGDIFNQYYNKNIVKDLVYLNPLSDFIVYKSLDSLFFSPPYSTMRIKYFSTLKEDVENNEIYKNKDLLSYLYKDKFDKENLFIITINYYINKKDYNKALLYINSMMNLFPANPLSYLISGYFYKIIGYNKESEDLFKFGYELSDCDILYFNNIKKIYFSQNDEEGFNKLQSHLKLASYKNKEKINSPKRLIYKIYSLYKEKSISDIYNYLYNVIYYENNSVYSLSDIIIDKIEKSIDFELVKNFDKYRVVNNRDLIKKYFIDNNLYKKDEYLKEMINRKIYGDILFYKKNNTIFSFIKYKGDVKLLFISNEIE